MGSKVREDLKKSFVASTGWLFADLLLALAMLFLAANTLSLPKPHLSPIGRTHKPTPTATAIPPQRLEQGYHRFSITVNPDLLLSNDAGEKAYVIQQVKAQSFLHNRSAGLIIVYGGALTDNDIPTATSIADAVYSILLDFGKKDATFVKVSKYDPLYLLGGDPTTVKLDVFLFAQ